MSAGSPVFGRDDRVEQPPNNDGLPAELAGKSPAEIARFYNERETRLRAELTRPPDATPPNSEFWNDPARAVKTAVAAAAVTKEEWEQIRQINGPALIYAAKASVKEQHPDWNRVEPEILKIMAAVPEWQHTQPHMWETAYVYAKGQAHDRLAAEDRAAPPIIHEGVQPGGTPAEPLQDLSRVTLPGLKPHQTAANVAEHLGITADSYRKSAKILEGDGLLPMTYDNRGKR
jgi:lysophospholipase L1-like esterase